jgi:Protein of unknown function (DUF2637)
MKDSPPATGSRSPDPVPGLRVVALIAAVLGVLVLTAAAFVLSYPGIHQLARTAGMSVSLARVFPVIFDALLVVSIAAVLSLHGAGWWRRGYSWLIMLLLLAAMAAGDVLHVLHTHIPGRPAAVTAAVLPWALLLIAFTLLLSMLRQFRQARAATAGEAADQAAPAVPMAGPRIGLDGLLGPAPREIAAAQPSRAATAPVPPAVRTSTVPITRPVPARPVPTSPADTTPAEATSADGAADRADTQRVEAEPAAEVRDETAPDVAGPEETGQDETGPEAGEPAASPGDGALHVPQQPMRAPVPAPAPHFDRLRSTPTPPEDDADTDA